MNAIEIAALTRDLLALPKASPARLTRGAARLAGPRHSRERDRAAIQYHYDVGNDFYALWLDRRMIYSCAYFPTGTEDLDSAQEKKLEHICRKLRLGPGERLLDIGCGWGALVSYAAEKYGVRALGVTLSQNQAELAQERIAAQGLQGRARVELIDYRDVAEAPFDKIVSVGMFEHVGRRKLPEYFAHAFRYLKPGGLFLNHGIAEGRRIYRPRGLRQKFAEGLVRDLTFGQRYVFPDGELETVNDVNAFAERAGFEVRDVESLREHYARTLRFWVTRLEAHKADAVRVAGETTYRVWRLYMAASVHQFDRAAVNVYQSLLSKPDADGTSHLPWSRADVYE